MRNVRTHGRRGVGSRPEGFSLLELLIVITIVGILAALLVPGFQGAREACWTAQCKTNLRTLYEAYGVRRADCVHKEQGVWEPAPNTEFEDPENTARFWTALVANYIDADKQAQVFTCPARAAWGYGGAYEDVEEQNVRTTGALGGGGGVGGPTDVWEPANDEIDAAIEFDVYFQAGSEGDVYGGGSNSGIRGEFCYAIPLGNSTWVRRTECSDHTNYKIDDEPEEGRSGNYDDLEINVYYEGNQPSEVKIQSVQTGSSGSVAKRFIFDLKICGEVVVEDIAGELQNGRSKVGDTIDLRDESSSGGSGPGGWRWDGEKWVSSHPWDFKIIVGDYAMSMGTFQRRNSSLVQDRVDSRLFFILDFGARKTVADFNHDESDDEWGKYFIRDVEQWARDFPDAATKGWPYYQALRHAGRANVLFCDGHVESLGADDLEYLDPRWVYEGR